MAIITRYLCRYLGRCCYYYFFFIYRFLFFFSFLFGTRWSLQRLMDWRAPIKRACDVTILFPFFFFFFPPKLKRFFLYPDPSRLYSHESVQVYGRPSCVGREHFWHAGIIWRTRRCVRPAAGTGTKRGAIIILIYTRDAI